MSKMSLFSLQGYIKIGARLPNGKPGALSWVGNVPEAAIELSAESNTKNESFSGQRLPYGKMRTSQAGRFTGTMDEWSTKNLAFGLYGSVLSTVAGSVTGEVFPTGLVVGDQVRLERAYASNLVLTDSTGAPVTVASADYRLVGHNAATVEILGLGATPYVQPFKGAYSYEGFESVDAFTQPAVDRYVVFDGINTETGEGVLIDLFRMNFDPFSNLGLIHGEYGSLPFAGDILYDPLNIDANNKGGFMRIRQKGTT